jgi:hypothetical protein
MICLRVRPSADGKEDLQVTVCQLQEAVMTQFFSLTKGLRMKEYVLHLLEAAVEIRSAVIPRVSGEMFLE